MTNLDFETFLLISPNKFIISIYQKPDFKKIYEKEMLIENKSKVVNIDLFKKFVDENIIEIEKKLKNFIEKINLIVESDKFFFVNSSIKKNYSLNNLHFLNTKLKIKNLFRLGS